MDPRHPELAVKRVKELIKNYEDVEKKISTATVSSQLGQFEREGGLIIQELCLVAPRIHEAMMQTSRRRRYDLSHGIAFGYTPEEKVGKYTKATIGIEEKPVENPVRGNADVIGEENIGGESGPAKKVPEIASEGVLEVVEAAKKNAEAEKPKKKTTRKKKTTKKAED